MAPDPGISDHVNQSILPVSPTYVLIRPTPTLTRPCLVMKGSPVRVRASAFSGFPGLLHGPSFRSVVVDVHAASIFACAFVNM